MNPVLLTTWAGLVLATRPSLPAESKVSDQAVTLMRVCQRVILANGGERIDLDGQPGFRVRLQTPWLVEALPPAPR